MPNWLTIYTRVDIRHTVLIVSCESLLLIMSRHSLEIVNSVSVSLYCMVLLCTLFHHTDSTYYSLNSCSRQCSWIHSCSCWQTVWGHERWHAMLPKQRGRQSNRRRAGMYANSIKEWLPFEGIFEFQLVDHYWWVLQSTNINNSMYGLSATKCTRNLIPSTIYHFHSRREALTAFVNSRKRKYLMMTIWSNAKIVAVILWASNTCRWATSQTF